MRAPLLTAVTLLLATCAHRTTPPSMEPPSAPGQVQSSVRFEYVPPTNPAHRAIYVEVQRRQVLEQFAEAVGVFRLPRMLTLRLASCDGTSNAFYLDTTTSVTFCYELLADIKKSAEASLAKDSFIPLADAIDGPTSFFMFHEAGHAIFDLLKVPILGKEEDAADTVAAIAILRLGKERALRLLRGTAWSFAHDARSRPVDDSDFADIHSLDSQRYYNLLCIAYGSDPQFFADAITRGNLPKDRAEWCGVEYRQALYAVQKLLAPSIDERELEYVKAKYARKGASGS